MSMKILNLDELETGIEKQVVLKGVTHKLHPFSVQQFIDNLKEIDAYAAMETVTVQEVVEHMVKMISGAFPTIAEADIRGLPMEKMKALSDFVKDQTQLEADEGIASDVSVPKNQVGESN